MSSFGWTARKIATLVATPIVMLTCITDVIPGAGAEVPHVSLPLVTSFTVSPNSLSNKGGTIKLQASLKFAQTCTLSASLAVTGLPKRNFSCASDSFSETFSIPKDTSAIARTYIFTLSVKNTEGSTTAPNAVVTEGGAPPPISFGTVSVEFRTVGVSIHSTNVEVQVTNNSTQPQTLGAFTIVGTNASDFAVPSNDCAGIVLSAGGGECSFAVDFVPTSTGRRVATLELDDASWGSAGTNALLPLSGTGVYSEISIGASSTFYASGEVHFGIQGVETTTKPLYVTVSDASKTVPLYVSSIGVSGQNFSDFGVSAGNCGATVIDPGAQCQFTVTFTPTASGLRKDQVDVYGNMSGGVWTIPETGTGEYATLTLDNAAGKPITAIDFGDETSGTRAVPVTVTNTSSNVFLFFGGQTGVFGQNGPDFNWTVGACIDSGYELAPSQHCTFTVVFQPSSGGVTDVEYYGSFSLYDNAQSGSETLQLSGEWKSS